MFWKRYKQLIFHIYCKITCPEGIKHWLLSKHWGSRVVVNKILLLMFTLGNMDYPYFKNSLLMYSHVFILQKSNFFGSLFHFMAILLLFSHCSNCWRLDSLSFSKYYLSLPLFKRLVLLTPASPERLRSCSCCSLWIMLSRGLISWFACWLKTWFNPMQYYRKY